LVINAHHVLIDEQTLHELSLLPLEMLAINADGASMVCSYPRINGFFALGKQFFDNWCPHWKIVQKR
jgi:hypothetical protein